MFACQRFLHQDTSMQQCFRETLYSRPPFFPKDAIERPRYLIQAQAVKNEVAKHLYSRGSKLCQPEVTMCSFNMIIFQHLQIEEPARFFHPQEPASSCLPFHVTQAVWWILYSRRMMQGCPQACVRLQETELPKFPLEGQGEPVLVLKEGSTKGTLSYFAELKAYRMWPLELSELGLRICLR